MKRHIVLASVIYVWASISTPTEADPDRFVTLEPGSALPSGSTCTEQVRRSKWEPRPKNMAANHRIVGAGARIDGADYEFEARFGERVDGHFSGTTDEILQWGSCKWGFDEDITRARAVQESYWNQSKQSDFTSDPNSCAKIDKKAPCAQSYGVLQVKGTVHEGTYPNAELSTAYNVDYALAWLRACYEGAFGHWLHGSYRAGDEWGCVGAWYSGRWYDPTAKKYIKQVKTILKQRTWERSEFN